ncbi:MAG: TniQ family protein [Gallionella sp.]|jgi:hypothetical protein
MAQPKINMQNSDPIVNALAVTPISVFGESMRGLILRTSEKNGFTNPKTILSYAGMSPAEMASCRPPIVKLAKLYGRTAATFDSMGCELNSGKSSYYILGHKLNVRDVNRNLTKVCPECVRDSGIIEAFWELRIAEACPIHKRRAISACPSCGQQLNWLRPGLLICRCGFDLSDCRGSKVTSELAISVLNMARAKLRNESIDYPDLSHLGFTQDALKKMSFGHFMSFCKSRLHAIDHERMARVNIFSTNSVSDPLLRLEKIFQFM